MSDKMSQAVVSVCGYDVTSLYDESTGDVWAVVQSMCDHIGIDSNRQIKKLQKEKRYQGFIRDLPMSVTQKSKSGSEYKRSYKVFCLHHRRLPTWLNSIQTQRVKPEFREILDKFQVESADVLYDYWSGKAITQKPSSALDNFDIAIQALTALRDDHKKLENRQYEMDCRLTRLEQSFHDDKQQRRKTAQRLTRQEAQTRFRFKLLDACGKACMRCDIPLTDDYMQIDEVYPVSQGGSREWNNVQALCARCNQWRKNGNWWESDYREKVPGFLDYCKSQWERKPRETTFRLQGYPVNQLPLGSLGTHLREF